MSFLFTHTLSLKEKKINSLNIISVGSKLWIKWKGGGAIAPHTAALSHRRGGIPPPRRPASDHEEALSRFGSFVLTAVCSVLCSGKEADERGCWAEGPHRALPRSAAGRKFITRCRFSLLPWSQLVGIISLSVDYSINQMEDELYERPCEGCRLESV